MTGRNCLMVVHAHPDDEVFSTGGILARYAAAGERVVVVYATRGEAGEVHDPDLDPEEARKRLGEIREREVRSACALLGVTDVYFLGYRDSGMADTEENRNPAAFTNAPIEESTGRLIEIMRATRPQVLVTYNENGGYGHPDHIMCNRVTATAFEQARHESWGPRKLYNGAGSREGFRRYVESLGNLGLKIPWMSDDFNFDEYGIPESDITALIDITSWAALKKRALALHRTQIPADFFYFAIPDEALTQVAHIEYFVRVYPPHRPGDRETDLFDGLSRSDATDRTATAVQAI